MSAQPNTRHIDRIAELEEEVRQLREILMPTMQFPESFKLTRTETEILAALYARAPRYISRDHIQFLRTRGADSDVNPSTVSVFIYRIRQKLAPFTIKIFALVGEGYYLNDTGRACIRIELMRANLPDPTMKTGAL